jgi:XTP/dITP diphosphohydrolase
MITILQELLPAWELLTLADFPNAGEPDETGSTYAENATIKAEAAAEATGELCIADDAGLEVDALDGAPGVFSKRFAGLETSFPDKIARILSSVGDNRGARFRCCVALAKTGEQIRVFEATKEGLITEPRGEKGFGYDPIFPSLIWARPTPSWTPITRTA